MKEIRQSHNEEDYMSYQDWKMTLKYSLFLKEKCDGKI